ncbi:hypothetical protein ASZ78_012866 [Callipepla squamata]|uniref:SCP domain-containing protein n=1 Tax=Callipepla squamata TaxID=9009 RepID=A0A226NNN0_CALSU|nr:hypothetical protein ASZ78_012866 [Callipepla squamata]
MKITFYFAVLFLLDLFVCCHTYDQYPLPDIEDPKFIEDCVRTHNTFRSRVNPPASNMFRMSWDPALAKSAKAWAKKCMFEHNIYLKMPRKMHPTFTSIGENIWTGTATIFSVHVALTDWFNEVSNYDFNTRHCTDMCGHYTQVVWATSYKVGCAVHFCPTIHNLPRFNRVAHFVCDYGPAGNYPTKPYKTGPPCSGCSNDQCVDKLCETLPDIGDAEFIEECVRMHNRFRSGVNPPASNMLYMVVWAQSYKVGCAVHFCPTVSHFSGTNAAHFVCNYGPA